MLPLGDDRFLSLLEAWGVPYSWGGGGPATGTAWPHGTRGTRGGVGFDCSGWVEAALVELGIMLSSAPRRNAAQLYGAGTPVPANEEQLGDLAFYGPGFPSHVMLVVAPGIVFGARGGDSRTNADDAKAFVQLEPLRYWNLFMGVRRLENTLGLEAA